MYLKDIHIYKHFKYKNTKEEQHLLLQEMEQDKKYRPYWINIRDLFSMRIPTKFNFLNIFKFNIELDDRTQLEFKLPDKNGIATYVRNDFCLNEFSKLSDLEKNIKTLFYIEDSLINICERYDLTDETVSVIRNIVVSIKDSNFEHFLIHKKTTKWHSGRKYRAVTKLHFKKGGIDANIEIVDKKNNVIISKNILANEFWENIWFVLAKGYWEKESFLIENRVGKVILNIQIP